MAGPPSGSLDEIDPLDPARADAAGELRRLIHAFIGHAAAATTLANAASQLRSLADDIEARLTDGHCAVVDGDPDGVQAALDAIDDALLTGVPGFSTQRACRTFPSPTHALIQN